MDDKKYNERLRFFRKNKEKTLGTALSFTYVPNRKHALFEIAPLISGTDNYNWSAEEKILINLSMKEVGDVLSLIKKDVQKVSFYHTPQKEDRPNIFVRVNCVWDADNEKIVLYFERNDNKKQHFGLTLSEIRLLEVACDEIVRLMLNWNNEDREN